MNPAIAFARRQTGLAKVPVSVRQPLDTPDLKAIAVENGVQRVGGEYPKFGSITTRPRRRSCWSISTQTPVATPEVLVERIPLYRCSLLSYHVLLFV